MVLPSAKEMELMSLIANCERSGRELAKAYEAEANRPISYGTLYTTMRRLEKEKWVSSREDTDHDGRLKFFTLTPKGGTVLRAARAELKRLSTFAFNHV